MKLLKALGKFALFVVAGFLALIIFYTVVLLVLIGPIPDCSENSASVAYARSLSQETLAKLYFDMEKHWATEHTPYAIGYRLDVEGEYVPEEFAHLEAHKVRPEQGNIMLEGCLDEFVYLEFEGFSSDSEPTEPRQIVLQYNINSYEVGREILWIEESGQQAHD